MLQDDEGPGSIDRVVDPLSAVGGEGHVSRYAEIALAELT
jgi:hypothetical protein